EKQANNPVLPFPFASYSAKLTSASAAMIRQRHPLRCNLTIWPQKRHSASPRLAESTMHGCARIGLSGLQPSQRHDLVLLFRAAGGRVVFQIHAPAQRAQLGRLVAFPARARPAAAPGIALKAGRADLVRLRLASGRLALFPRALFLGPRARAAACADAQPESVRPRLVGGGLVRQSPC